MMRFRPHFSLRTLAILVTLVCAYLAAWEATKRYGVSQIVADAKPSSIVISCRSPTPCLVQIEARALGYLQTTVELEKGKDEVTITQGPDGIISGTDAPDIFVSRRYYVWLFGPTIMLPFESKRLE